MMNNNGKPVCLYSIWTLSGESSICGDLAKFNYQSGIREIPICEKHMKMALEILKRYDEMRKNGKNDDTP